MYNSLRLLLVLLLAPMLATAQANNNAPCPDVTIDLSGLAELKTLKMEELADFKQLAQLENLAELKGWADMELLLDQTLDLNSEAAAYDAEKRKTIDKTFKVSSKDILKIDNQWGKVHVNTWDKNEIRVKVDVVTHASTEAKAQEMLDNIKIMESREGNTYTFRTQKDIRISGNNKQGLEINYTVYMPAENGIAVKNRFGDVYLPSMKGKADIDIQYGNLKCDRLA
ncbi:MAG: hypothetical protein LPK03_14160, partial [Pontibacter sp.]|nr:hypothetical protein [Pontibacter sp.]